MAGGKGKGKKCKDKKRKDKKRAEQFVPRSLPDDAITEILLRFPVRSVLRFRSVSKGWCAKIDSPEFKKKHQAYQRLASARSRYDENEFIVVNREYSMSTADFSCRMNVLSCYDDYKSLSELKSSCDLDINSMHFSSVSYNINGIVCVLRDPGCVVYLCNPALREIRELPAIPGFPARLGIASPYKIGARGIGFDDAADDYVLVKFVHDCGDDSDANDLKCVSYHVKAESWAMIEVPPAIVSAYASGLKKLYASTTKLDASFFSHGCIHWCMDWRHMVLTLNTTTRSFQEILFPRGWKNYGYDEYFYLLKYESSSTIALVGFRGRDMHKIDIWVMKEYGVADSWTKQYFISVNSIPGVPRTSRPLCFWRKDKIFLLGSNFICYDLGKGQLHEPPLHGQRESLPDSVDPEDYIKAMGLMLFPVMSGGKKKYILIPDPNADTNAHRDTDYEPPRRRQDDNSSLPHPDMTPLDLVTCSGSLVSVYQA